MDKNEICEIITKTFSEVKISEDENNITICTHKEKIRDLALFVRNELGFTYCNMAFGTDLKTKMEMSWYVCKMDTPYVLIIRSEADRENPSFPSLADLWNGMDWNEREAYDLLGIKFEGHNDLRRIYLPDNWEGYPLRDDYIYKRPQYHKPEDKKRS